MCFELKNAKEFLNTYEFLVVADKVHNILQDEDLKQQNEQVHYQIAEQARILGQELFAQKYLQNEQPPV